MPAASEFSETGFSASGKFNGWARPQSYAKRNATSAQIFPMVRGTKGGAGKKKRTRVARFEDRMRASAATRGATLRGPAFFRVATSSGSRSFFNGLDTDQAIGRIHRACHLRLLPFMLSGGLLVIQFVGGVAARFAQNELFAALADGSGKLFWFGLLRVRLILHPRQSRRGRLRPHRLRRRRRKSSGGVNQPECCNGQCDSLHGSPLRSEMAGTLPRSNQLANSKWPYSHIFEPFGTPEHPRQAEIPDELKIFPRGISPASSRQRRRCSRVTIHR